MNRLLLTGILSLDTRYWIGASVDLHNAAATLRVGRDAVQYLAREVRENMQSLRYVSPRVPPSPSLATWGLTIALMLVVSPTLAVRLCRLFLACVGFRLDEYVAIAYGLAFLLGAGMAMTVGLVCL